MYYPRNGENYTNLSQENLKVRHDHHKSPCLDMITKYKLILITIDYGFKSTLAQPSIWQLSKFYTHFLQKFDKMNA
jgi:hypothetical protein